MANELKMVFGSSTTVISLAAALASGANTYTGLTGLTNTQLDNSTLLYPYARAVLGVPDTFAAAPTAAGGAPQSAGWAAVKAAISRLATRAEESMATGAGTQAAPSLLGFDGMVSSNDCIAIRNAT